MVKSGTGYGRICFKIPAKSGSGRISQKQIWYSPVFNTRVFYIFNPRGSIKPPSVLVSGHK